MQTIRKEKYERRCFVASDIKYLPKLTVSQEWLDEADDEAEDEIRPVSLSALCGSNWARLFDEYYRKSIVYIRDINIVLVRFEYLYEVNLDRINSELDLLRWTLHLCTKTYEHRAYRPVYRAQSPPLNVSKFTAVNQKKEVSA